MIIGYVETNTTIITLDGGLRWASVDKIMERSINSMFPINDSPTNPIPGVAELHAVGKVLHGQVTVIPRPQEDARIGRVY